MNKLSKLHIILYSGLLLKLLLGSLFASHFLSEFFIPFVEYFTNNGLSNPYVYFVDHNAQAFPYPALMLYIMALPKLLLSWLDVSNTIGLFDLFIYHIPLVLADLSIFFILKSWLKDKFIKFIWFYWFSPVLIYISYIHGQLDVIPIALLFGSLYFLFKERFLLSALFLGFALSSKTHIAIVYPFFFLYLVSKHITIKKVLLLGTSSIATFLLLNLPFLFDVSYFKMVFQNIDQNKVFLSFLPLGELSFYLIPASLMLLFIKGALLRNYNKDIFIMFLGFSFSIILLFIPPMQGWYFWLIPFLVYFYMKEEGRSHLLFWGLQGFYLLYFILIENADYLEVLQFIAPSLKGGTTIYTKLSNLGIDANKIVDISFTMLQTVLLVNCFWIYRQGLESFRKQKITASPFLIGIGGNSGVGKTTLANALEKIFTPKNTTIIKGDDMHKWQRGNKQWDRFTHLDPKANELHREIYFLRKLKSGASVYRRHYDHNTGQFNHNNILKANNIIIFEGLHPFYLKKQRELYDLKIFVNPTKELAYHWKIIRDIKQRKHSKEKILEQITKREKDAQVYIETQKKHADILIEPSLLQNIQNIGNEKEVPKVLFKFHLSNSIFLEPLIDELALIPSLEIKHLYTNNDEQSLLVSGKATSDRLSQVADKIIPRLTDISNPAWREDEFGVLVLIITYCVFEETKEEFKNE